VGASVFSSSISTYHVLREIPLLDIKEKLFEFGRRRLMVKRSRERGPPSNLKNSPLNRSKAP
jgi:hypothetical protein